jgi:2,5-furandicarboxylate decarboxylase 1
MRSLRTYLDKLQRTEPDQLLTVKEPVDWRYEVTRRVAETEKIAANPALLFMNVRGYSMPLLVNLFGNIDRIHLGLDGARVNGGRLDFYRDWNRLFGGDVPPVHVGGGPVKEVIQKGGEVDLESLPIPLFYEQDGGRYVTAGLLTARNPEDPAEVNLSYVRMHLKGRDRFGVSLHSRGHMWQYYERAKAAGEPLEVAVTIGAHPSLYLAAAAKITGEYGKAGTLQGEAVELVGCETVDVPVPAQAEIVLEGVVSMDEEDEGPFTEYTGYISGRSTRNQLRVTAVTRRRDAVFLAVAPSNSAEHLLLSGLPKQARISRAITDYIHTPALKDIIWPVWGTHFACFISLSDAVGGTLGLAKHVALLLMGLDHYVKLVAVLPEAVNISNVTDVLETVARRCDFRMGSDVEVLGEVFSQWLDPSSPQAGVSSKMILDATGPEIGGETSLCVVKPGLDADPGDILCDEAYTMCRLIVYVDDDIDAHDHRQVLWAVATRSQPDRDTVTLEGRMAIDARKGRGWTATRATLPST